MANIKWSAFTLVGPLATGDTLVGLRAGNNVRFNTLTIPWSPSLGGTGVANTGTITVGGNTAFSGAFTFTGTLTGNTDVTFPTSGTLATTANASGIVNSGLINQLAYYAADGITLSGLAIVNSAGLTTTAGGVPTWIAATGTGAPVFATSPTLVTPVLGAATGTSLSLSGALSAASASFTAALPVLSGGTGVTTSTGSGANVLSTSPTLVTPDIGVATGTSLTLSGALSAASATLTAALTGANGGTGIANTGKTITIGGNLSTIGAFTSDFTMTANTSVTFPTSGTLATTASASGIVNSGLINQLAYYAAAGTTLSGLATGNNGVLITSAAGLPSISSTLPTAVQQNITGLGVIAQNITMTQGGGSNLRFILLNGSTTGGMALQAGIGSAASGGGLVMYSSSHASKAGWVTAGISSGSGGSFTVNNQGLGGGQDVFTVSVIGRITSGNQATGSSGSLTLNGSTAGLGSLLFSTVNNSGDFQNNLVNAATSAARTYTLPDASGTITVLGNAVTGSGSIVLATSPTLVTPVLGVATGTSLALSGALSADSASFTSALTGANGGTGVANTGKTITIGGNLSTVGAFTSDFTMTGNTAVTFPTSGTLATTATASGIINSGLINQLAFYAAAGTTLSGVTTANNGLLVTSAAGVPSIGNDILANIAVNGVQVGRGAANVASNVFIGTAGNAAATGTDNQAVSSSTCFQNLTTGASNTGMGSNVFSAITVGGFNVCVGLDAGRSMAASNNNVIIGAQAGDSYVGFSSVMIGRAAGFSMTSSNNSVVIGLNAGRGAAAGSAAIITGTINTLIGANASGNASTASGLIALGAEAVALGATGVGSGANGPGIAIGSDLHKVGFRGDGTMYPGNMWRPRINGATYMVPLLVDGSTSTGTGNLVLATSPTLVTPVLGVATATSLVLSGALSAGSASFTSALPVLSGGTGVTTSTGSGSNVLSTSPTLVTPALGTPTSGVLTNCTGLVATTGLTATGTKDSTTFLRGDNTFAVPASGSGNAKAWVNFNGVGTPAIRASFGVASVTSVSTAVYEINFSVAFSAANYGYSFGCGRAGLGGGFMIEGPAVAPTTTAFRCGTFNASFSADAAPYVGASFFGA